MRRLLFTNSGTNLSPKNVVIPLLLLFSCANEELPIHESTNTNLVLVTIDTLRTDRIGVYGGPENLTPAIDALAKRGVTFLDTSAHAPLTVPSHAALLTGKFPNRLGVRDNAGFPLEPSIETLAETLKAAGYRTGAFVSSYVLNRHTGLSQGFDTYTDRFATGTVHLTPASLERPGPEVASEAEEWLKSIEEPFFLWTHYYDPHSPYEAPRAFADQWPDDPYNAEVATADWALGQLLQAIPESMRSRTLIVFTADHGESLGEHGEPEHGIFLYDAALKVPLVMAGPQLPVNLTYQDQVRHVDVVPTILALLGLTPPSGLDGESLLPRLGKEANKSSPPSYAESSFGYLHFGCSELRSLRDGNWKYIEAPRPELYNVKNDPRETQNLIDVEKAVAEQMALELENMAIAEVPTGPGLIDSETRERLRSLGYVGGTVSLGSGGVEDPKDRIADYVAYIEKFNDSLQALNDGNSQKAAQGFGRLARQFPLSYEAHQYFGRALAGEEDYSAAMKAYDTAIELSPQSADVYLDAALCLAEQGDFNRAFDYVERGFGAEPNYFYGHLVEGIVARRAAMTARATEAFEKALSLNPELAVAEFELGSMAAERGAKEEAARRFRRALDIDPMLYDARLALDRLESTN